MNHKQIIEEYSIPYKSKDGLTIEFPYSPLNGVVFVWTRELPTMYGNIYLVENVREDFKSSKGVVLAAHSGVKNKRTKQWVECMLKPGDEILYDKSIPWSMMIPASDGKEYKVELMSMLDVNALVLSNGVKDERQSLQESSR